MSELLKNIWAVHCRAMTESMPGRGSGGIVPFVFQADDPWIHPDTCHPYRCFRDPVAQPFLGEASSAWICEALQGRERIFLSAMCLLNPASLCLVCGDREWYRVHHLGCLAAHDICRALVIASFPKKSWEKRWGLQTGIGVQHRYSNCGASLGVSVPLEQYRTWGKCENLLKDKNKCLSLAAPGIIPIKLYVYLYMHNALSNCFKTPSPHISGTGLAWSFCLQFMQRSVQAVWLQCSKQPAELQHPCLGWLPCHLTA